MLQSLPTHVCGCGACVRQRTRLQWDEMETRMEFQWVRPTAKASVHLNAISLRVRTKKVPQICRMKRKILLERHCVERAACIGPTLICSRKIVIAHYYYILRKIPFGSSFHSLASTWDVICVWFVAPICFPHSISPHRRWSEVLLFDSVFVLEARKHDARAKIWYGNAGRSIRGIDFTFVWHESVADLCNIAMCLHFGYYACAQSIKRMPRYTLSTKKPNIKAIRFTESVSAMIYSLRCEVQVLLLASVVHENRDGETTHKVVIAHDPTRSQTSNVTSNANAKVWI